MLSKRPCRQMLLWASIKAITHLPLTAWDIISTHLALSCWYALQKQSKVTDPSLSFFQDKLFLPVNMISPETLKAATQVFLPAAGRASQPGPAPWLWPTARPGCCPCLHTADLGEGPLWSASWSQHWLPAASGPPPCQIATRSPDPGGLERGICWQGVLGNVQTHNQHAPHGRERAPVQAIPSNYDLLRGYQFPSAQGPLPADPWQDPVWKKVWVCKERKASTKCKKNSNNANISYMPGMIQTVYKQKLIKSSQQPKMQEALLLFPLYKWEN